MQISRASSTRFLRVLTAVCLVSSTSACQWWSLVSTSGGGKSANSASTNAALSGNGRYVAFWSLADDLVPGDTNGVADIFVRDTSQGTTTRVSVNSTGDQATGDAGRYVDISADGRYVVFESYASDLVPDDTNNVLDVFVHDRNTGVTSRVNLGPGGVEDNGASQYSRFPSISDDGRYVAYASYGTNLVAGDTDNAYDVFVYDRQTGTTTCASIDPSGNHVAWNATTPRISGNGRYVVFAAGGIYLHDLQSASTSYVSVNSAGNSANKASYTPDISADGRYIAFISDADNLVPGDTNGHPLAPVGADTFVHDRVTETTTRASVDSNGNQWDKDSHEAPSISADGRYIAFEAGDREIVVDPRGVAIIYHNAIFVYDQLAHSSQVISETDTGETKHSELPSISADGRYVGFQSGAENFIPAGPYTTQSNIFIFANPRLAITGVVPNKVPLGATTSVTITGAHFRPGMIPGTDATFTNVVVVNANTITADITVPAARTSGARNLNVFLLGTGPGALTGSFVTCANCLTYF